MHYSSMRGILKLSVDYSLCLTASFIASYIAKTYFKTHLSLTFTTLQGYLLTYLFSPYKTESYLSPWFQRLSIWRNYASYFSAKINIEDSFRDDQQYIFAAFPHGACTGSHLLTMTDCCGMLSSIFKGERRDLAASILFYVPLLREMILLLGCVDAGASTANYNLKKGRSLLIYVGGEKEQLLTKPNVNKVHVIDRKGFIKLSIQYGAHLVPTYCYGENELFETYDIGLSFRLFLQKNFQIGIPIINPIPHKIPLTIEMGRPIPVVKKAKEDISQKDIDDLHSLFVDEMRRLFERTKHAHGIADDVKLIVH